MRSLTRFFYLFECKLSSIVIADPVDFWLVFGAGTLLLLQRNRGENNIENDYELLLAVSTMRPIATTVSTDLIC